MKKRIKVGRWVVLIALVGGFGVNVITQEWVTALWVACCAVWVLATYQAERKLEKSERVNEALSSAVWSMARGASATIDESGHNVTVDLREARNDSA